jgi:hypothetical protein
VNRVLRRIFGPKRDEVTGEWRKLHNEELVQNCLLGCTDDGGSTHLCNVGRQSFYMAVHPRRQF